MAEGGGAMPRKFTAKRGRGGIEEADGHFSGIARPANKKMDRIDRRRLSNGEPGHKKLALAMAHPVSRV
jgi:hypothetical protein